MRREAFRRRVTGEGLVEVARRLGIHRTTLFRWERSHMWTAELMAVLDGRCDRRVLRRRRRLLLAREMTTVLAERAQSAMEKRKDRKREARRLHVAFVAIEAK
jgi:hypothetical protein